MDNNGKQDLEASKGAIHNHASVTSGNTDDGFVDETYEVKRARELQENNGFFRKLKAGEEWSVDVRLYMIAKFADDTLLRLDDKMGVESQGIDRVHEDKKEPPSIWNVCSDCMQVTLLVSH